MPPPSSSVENTPVLWKKREGKKTVGRTHTHTTDGGGERGKLLSCTKAEGGKGIISLLSLRPLKRGKRTRKGPSIPNASLMLLEKEKKRKKPWRNV